MPTIGGIVCTEPYGSLPVELGEEGGKGRRILDCAWADRYTVTTALLGSYTRAGGLLLVFVDPSPLPGIPEMVAKRTRIAPLGTMGQDINGDPSYTFARIDVEYGLLDWDAGDEEQERTIATEQLSFSAEFVEMPELAYTWAGGTDNGKAIPSQIGKIMPTIEHILTRQNLDTLPKDDISTRLGTVNDDLFLGVAAGKILFAGASARREVTAEGQKPYELQLVFREREEKWNQVFNTTDQVWQDVAPDIYGIADLEPLLDSINPA